MSQEVTQTFTLSTPQIDAESNALICRFEHPEFGAFVERVIFPKTAPLHQINPGVREALLGLAAVVMGSSYFKARPCAMIQSDAALTSQALHLAKLTYGPGLGEFYVRNALAYPPEFSVVADIADGVAIRDVSTSHAPRAVCAFGGGKDSHVARSVLQAAGADVELVSVFLSKDVAARMQTMSTDAITFIQRVIDPRLIELSRSGDALNGHIPITAINSVLLTLYAEASRQDWVVFANERAASEPTLEVEGHPVNHQFSKSLEFEEALGAAFAAAGARARYFSILRPVSELWTAHELATRSQALDIFASCNRNFVFAGPKVLEPGQRWCGTCPKCVYTSVLLAPFLDAERHAQVFQSRPLHDGDNMAHLRDIAGLTDAKPWECVGERREVAAALHHLQGSKEWSSVPLVAAIASELYAHWSHDELDKAWAQALDARSTHRMPDAVAEVMGA